MQKLNLLLAILLAFSPNAAAQLTLRVNAISVNTPVGATIHIAGTLNNWNPGDPAFSLSPIGSGEYQIVLNPPPGEIKFKFTRGSWASVEGNANGTFLPDRSLSYNGQPVTVTLSILSWEDLGTTNGTGTAASNVQILSNDFYIPQLNRSRRIWICLPPDYTLSSKRYPVLYMHDGQNLFDQSNSFSGEWKVDESLNALHTQGDRGCIVVGIDNGGQYRLDEYSPWIHPQYGGGQGDEYVDFIVNTLKPYIDAHFRSLPGRNATGIAGSSMGGLISMYALAERQDVFSKAGIFSPAFWFGGNAPAVHVTGKPKTGDVRVYFLAGADEENDGNQSNYVVEDMQEVANAMSTAGFDTMEKSFNVISDGKHSEWFWAREFPAAYQWLFADLGTAGLSQNDTPAKLGIFPNPSSTWLRFSGLEPQETIDIQIIGNDGKLWREWSAHAGEQIWTGDLPAGFYLIKARKNGGIWEVARFVRA